MPAKRKTKAEKRAYQFKKMFDIGKASTGIDNRGVAKLLGIGEATLYSRLSDPDKFTVGELVCLSVAFDWDNVNWILTGKLV